MTWTRFPLVGFVPALPVTTPGAIVKVDGAVPTDRGLGNPPEFANTSSSAMAAASVGGASLYKTDGTNRIFAGSPAKLYELSGATLTDRSGAGYNASAAQPWSFAQFGDISIAANKGDTPQFIGAGGTFAAISGAPKAAIVIACGPVSAQFVMLFDVNDGTDIRDRWVASAINDYTGWTAGSNLSSYGRLLDEAPGPITAAIPFRDGAVAFKANAMYLGTFNGFNPVWSWSRISTDIGCIGKNALVEAGDVIYFADAYGIWYFDGSYPRPVDQRFNQFWASEVAARVTGASNANFWVRANWDRSRHLLSFSVPNGSSLGIVEVAGWNKVSGLWSLFTPPLAVYEMISPTVYTDSVTKKLGTYDYAAAAGTTNIYTHIIGSPVQAQKITGIRPGWTLGPSVTTPNWLSGQVLALDDLRSAQPNSVSGSALASFQFRQPGYLDGLASSRYMAPVITINNGNAGTAWEFDSYWLDLQPAGTQ